MIRDLLGVFFNLLKVAGVAAAVYFPVVVVAHFPQTVGPTTVSPIEEEEVARGFYEAAYQHDEEDGADSVYVETARSAAHGAGVEEKLKAFIAERGLADKRHLEVGAGSGALQDVVDDYTGLDIAGSAARYFHKPFVQGSATDLPFQDNEFDAAWTIWTLEHVPEPEKALEELRRVVKPGGSLFVYPAWNAVSWAGRGYAVRPYRDFGWKGKAIKASLAVRAKPLFIASWLIPIRLIRHAGWLVRGSETRLRYSAIEPNYTKFWQPDSDATASIDSHEAMLWFISRGDECENCPDGLWDAAWMPYSPPLIIRVGK